MLEQWMSIVLVILAGVVGYLAGALRDRRQTKANRNARHEDETLAAAAAVIEGARLMSTASEDVAWARTNLAAQYRAQIASPGGSRPAQPADVEERDQAWKDQASARAVFQPALLKLSILKPELGREADALLLMAGRSGDDFNQWKDQADAFEAAVGAFVGVVSRVLKVKAK